MDVIDLCDDDEEMTVVEPEDPLGTADSVEQIMPTELPVSGLQIVDVQSLSTSEDALGAIEKSNGVIPAKRSSRRKTVHQPINTNDQAEFVYTNSGTSDDEFIDFSELANKERAPVKDSDSNDIIDIMERIKKAPNPNADLLKRVAFLRVSVQFTLQELGYKTFAFSRNCNLQNLKNQYLRDKKLKQMRKK